jgi:hypothetical protein
MVKADPKRNLVSVSFDASDSRSLQAQVMRPGPARSSVDLEHNAPIGRAAHIGNEFEGMQDVLRAAGSNLEHRAIVLYAPASRGRDVEISDGVHDQSPNRHASVALSAGKGVQNAFRAGSVDLEHCAVSGGACPVKVSGAVHDKTRLRVPSIGQAGPQRSAGCFPSPRD